MIIHEKFRHKTKFACKIQIFSTLNETFFKVTIQPIWQIILRSFLSVKLRQREQIILFGAISVFEIKPWLS